MKHLESVPTTSANLPLQVDIHKSTSQVGIRKLRKFLNITTITKRIVKRRSLEPFKVIDIALRLTMGLERTGQRSDPI